MQTFRAFMPLSISQAKTSDVEGVSRMTIQTTFTVPAVSITKSA